MGVRRTGQGSRATWVAGSGPCRPATDDDLGGGEAGGGGVVLDRCYGRPGRTLTKYLNVCDESWNTQL